MNQLKKTVGLISSHTEGGKWKTEHILPRFYFLEATPLFSVILNTDSKLSIIMSYENRVALIHNPKTGLVLDGKIKTVKLMGFTGEQSQLWTIQTHKENIVLIHNKASGLAMDASGGLTVGTKLITYKPHTDPNQQWIIHDDYISSSNPNLVLEIPSNNQAPGAEILVNTKQLGDNQKFKVVLLR